MFYFIAYRRILETRFVVVYPSLIEVSFVTYEDELLAALLGNYLG